MKNTLNKFRGNKVNYICGNTGDSYTTVNTFIKNRRIKSDVFEIMSFFIDLDINESEFFLKKKGVLNKYLSRMMAREISIDELSDLDYEDFYGIEDLVHNFNISFIRARCKKLGLQDCSKINFSGRGYHVYFNITSIGGENTFGMNGRMMSEMNDKIQKLIYAGFKDLGADKNALDVGRVLRDENTINSRSHLICKNVYKSNYSKPFSFYAKKLFKYSHRSYKKLKNKTSIDQQELLSTLIKRYKIGPEKLKTEYRIISNDKHCDIPYLTIFEAGKIISLIQRDYQKNDVRIDNLNYISNLMDIIARRKNVKEGNRSIYFYYVGIGFKREKIDKNTAEIKALKIRDKYNVDYSEKDVKKSIRDAYKVDNLNISKKTILKSITQCQKEIDDCLKGKRMRSTKKEVNFIKMSLKKNPGAVFKNSDRTLSKVYKVSRTVVVNIRKAVNVILMNQEKLIKIISYSSGKEVIFKSVVKIKNNIPSQETDIVGIKT